MITSKLNHTPGPWSVAPNSHCVFTDASAVGRGVAMCAMVARAPGEIIANTQLIAAAPELLQACRFILKFDGKKLGSLGEAILRRAINAATDDGEMNMGEEGV